MTDPYLLHSVITDWSRLEPVPPEIQTPAIIAAIVFAGLLVGIVLWLSDFYWLKNSALWISIYTANKKSHYYILMICSWAILTMGWASVFYIWLTNGLIFTVLLVYVSSLTVVVIMSFFLILIRISRTN